MYLLLLVFTELIVSVGYKFILKWRYNNEQERAYISYCKENVT